MNVETHRLLETFAAAWNAHDVDTLVACMTEDGEFRAAAGDDQIYVGPVALREAFTAIFARFPDARWLDPVHSVAGDIALSEWTFVGTGPDGMAVQARGCDVFRLRDGRIAIKDTFRKQIPLGPGKDGAR